MIALERSYALLSPAKCGREERLGEVRAALCRKSAAERADGDGTRVTEKALFVVPARYAPEGGFRSGAALRECGRRGGTYTVSRAIAYRRFWTLEATREVTKGEA